MRRSLLGAALAVALLLGLSAAPLAAAPGAPAPAAVARHGSGGCVAGAEYPGNWGPGTGYADADYSCNYSSGCLSVYGTLWYWSIYSGTWNVAASKSWYRCGARSESLPYYFSIGYCTNFENDVSLSNGSRDYAVSYLCP